LKQQLLIEYFDEQWSDSKEEDDHQKEKNHQIQNKGSQLKIGNNQNNKKNHFHNTEVEK
jgi:hypothetical protein